jgi:threonine aldolase
MIIKKLTAMPYAQAHIEIDEEGNISLFSYVTRVATFSNDKFLTVYGLYSQTTRKHISAFCREYCGCTYAEAKAAYEGKYSYNTETGEVVFFDEEG